MILKQSYKSLNNSLGYFRTQVIESLPYAREVLPAHVQTPEQIFNWLKLRTTYKNDPKGVELFQTFPTLLENNFHGIPGAGDCDCFTIAALACLLVRGYDCGIVLAGRNGLNPVHIWAYVIDKGQTYDFDLTNKYFNQSRHYSHTQKIPFVLSPKEKKMFLQLAEGGRERAAMVYNKGRKKVKQYVRDPREIRKDIKYIRNRAGVLMREDIFDNMSAGEFQNMCLAEGIEQGDIEQLSARRAERKAFKQQAKTVKASDKQAVKATKPRQARKTDKAAAKQQVKATKAQAQLVKQQSKAVRREAQGAAKIARTTSPNYQPWHKSAGDVVNTAIRTFSPPQNNFEIPEEVEAEEFYYPEDEEIFEIENESEVEPMEEGSNKMLRAAGIGLGIGLLASFIKL